MTFIIPEEELTTDGPYCIGEVRSLSSLEVVYTEMMLQVELQRLGANEVLVASAPPGPSAMAMGQRASAVAGLPDHLALPPQELRSSFNPSSAS